MSIQINPNKLTTGDFFFGQTLGEGAFARVVHAKLKSHSDSEFAIKIMDKNHIKKENKVKYVMMEKAVLAKLTHPFVLKLFYTFQDVNSLYMCMEMLHGGELLHFILKNRKEKEKNNISNQACDFPVTQFYMAELVDAMEYMHSELVVHRDLKPENLIIAANGHLRVADFGTAMIMKEKEIIPSSSSSNSNVNIIEGQDNADADAANESTNDDDSERGSFVGTAEYVSPEILQDTGVSTASDLWAIGCIIYQMLVGKPPLRGESEYLTFQTIIGHCDGTAPLEYPSVVNSNQPALELISQLLQANPIDRYGNTIPNPIPDTNPNPDSDSMQSESNAVYTLKQHSFFDGINFNDLATSEPLYIPNPTTFPSTTNMFDGASDDWQLGFEPTLLDNSDHMNFAGTGTGTGLSEKEKWKQFLNPNEQQILTGTVFKRKGLFSKKRQLVLTDKPRLIYIDGDKLELKGEVPWTYQYPVSCNIVS